MNRIVSCASLTIVCLAFLTTSNSFATTIGFEQITNNGTENPEAQLSVNVSDSFGQVLFKFSNAGPMASSITQIYWDDDSTGVISNGPTVDAGSTSPGVSFNNIPASPSDLPNGGTVGFMADFSAGRTSQGGVSNGVEPGEMVGFLFDGTAASVVSAIQNGTFRMGLHVQAIGVGGQSESFVSIPEPATFATLASGMLLCCLCRGRVTSA